MKPLRLLLVTGVLAIGVGELVFVPPLMAKSSRTSIKQRIRLLLQRKSQKRKQASEARKKLRLLKRREHTVASQVQETQEDLEHAREKLHSVSRKLQRTQASLTSTQGELQSVEERLTLHNQALGDRLTSIYKNGSFAYLEIILDSQSFSDVVQRSYFFRRIVENDVNLLKSITNEKNEVKVKRDVLTTQKRQVERMHVEAAQQKQEVATQAAKERQLLFKVRHERAAYEDYVRTLEQSSNEITSLIRRLTSRPSGGGVVPWRGGFTRPVAGRVTSSFGYRMHPIFKVRRFHTGVDLSVPYGTTVHAAARGRCIFAGWKPAYGKTLIIDHGGGLATVYGHCSALLVSEGAMLRQGQAIARVGSTGISTGPHLHFEVRRHGAPVNPL